MMGLMDVIGVLQIYSMPEAANLDFTVFFSGPFIESLPVEVSSGSSGTIPKCF